MTPTSSIAIISMLALSTGACATAPSSVVTSAPAPASAIPKIDAQLSARDELDDSEITVAVEHMLANELGTSARDIRVVTTAGVVQLTGTAPHLLASDRAMLLAELIRGVRSVSNQIQVTRSARSDSEIADEVDRAFVLDPATESFEIDVSVSDRVVALQGTVSSWTEKQLATRVARGIRGVRAVEDEIDVRYELTRADQEILADIESRLEWDAIVDEGLIDVGVTEGVVVLTGAVGSAAERRRARGLAWVAGVQDVYDAELRVSWWLDEPRARDEEYVPKSAKEVRAALETAMLLDPRVASFSVTPEVDGSHVVLRGTVDNLRAKLSAGQIARHTVGVAAVDNRLEVEPRRVLTDLEIEDGLRWSLVANPITEAHEIGVDVDDGSATLTGMVGSLAERAEAEDIALGTTGVRA
ncbi:MAG: BON domain-containing protein, partial [Nannocystaceae bacterium]